MDEFDRIYSEYYDTVFRYALSLCGDEGFAEEITQESFFKALKSIDKFRGGCKLSVWLCQIAKNTFLTLVKRRKRNIDYTLEAIPEEGSFEERLIDGEDARQIHRLLHGLDEPYKEVFWMRVFGELSFAEIAALFGRTESWARVTYHRARAKIKEGLQ
ncbi:MAG: sigma-70 family RNA polymerase sigma factor [Lachnospiraceae bacterium]|nr:sigma-70 family RNA polymerase sigma factor [Ruminococcus sp.]MCM1274460.1 sigma-70 family RNA polymerase sigma factor [Lachnospiraceae bacterium]